MKDNKRPLEMSKTSGKQQQKRTGGDNKQGAKAQSKQKKPSSRDEEDEDEEDDCSESDEEDDVSRALFYYANAIITEGLTTSGMESELQSAMKALEKCKFLLLHQNPLLQKMVKKAASRDMSDNKVPPGSASVQRDLQDDRFLLSLVCIGCSKIQAIINQDMEAAVVSLKDALVFFPRSAEANENIAQLLRTQADTQEKLNSVENYFRKAMNSKEQIQKAIECSSVSLGTISLLAASKVPNTTTTSSGGGSASSKSKSKKESRSDAMGNTIIEDDDDDGDDSDENENGDKNKNKNENDDDDDDEEADQLEEEVLRNILEMELSASLRASENLLLHLCQEGRCSEALPLLREGKYLIRLSRDVLCYKINGESEEGEEKKEGERKDGKEVEESSAYLRVTDGILSTNTLSHLQHIFRPSSPFWSEHQYNLIANSSRTAGYFSYVYDLRELPSNSIEQVICVLFEKVKEMFPSFKNNKNNKSGTKNSKRDSKKDGEGETGEGEECVYAEWWVHTRPHSSGHQLHFDSDNEGLTRQGGKPLHPVCSSVLYLQEGVGGPTLVTDQTLGGNIATKGWMSYPKTNRVVLFDAKYLHGVVPGRGKNPDPSSRRLTLMVGFWKDLKMRTKKDIIGPNQIFPSVDSKYSWWKEMEMLKEEIGDLRGSESVAVTPQFVSPIWELVSERNNSDDVNMEEGNGEDGVGASETGGRVRKEGEGGQKGEGEKRKGERKGDSEEEKGRRGQGRDSTHTQSLPSASYAQSFQGF